MRLPETKQPNPQYIINALTNQIAQLSAEKAARDAIITEQQQEINDLKQKLEKQLEEPKSK